MLSRFRLVVALFVSLGLLFGLLAITAPAPYFIASAQPGFGSTATLRVDTGPVDPGFGPTLFLVTISSNRDLGALPPTVSIHTPLDVERSLYIASGGPDDLGAARDAGIGATLLDADTTGRRYYLVDGRPDPTRDPARDLVFASGEILYDAGHTLLAATSEDRERALVETLTSRGVQLSLVTADPLRFADAGGVDAAAFDRIAEADPFIAGLLEQLNTTDLATLIGELSGETAVVIGDSTVVIDTRYTFSSRIDESERYLFQAYEQMGVAAQYADWTYGSYSGRNIIADVQGVLHPERIWLVGGHFDSISEVPYSSAPGADDNASGSASTLLMARILSQVDLADSVRFVHFSGEEQGQWGSKKYVSTLAGEEEEIMGYIDIDMIGWDGNEDRVAELHTGTGATSNLLGTAMIDAGDAYSLGLTFERKTTSASRFSDHSPFWDSGYPALLAIENFFEDDIPADHSPWYHNSDDSLTHVDLDYVLAYARTALATVAELAGAAESIESPTPTPTPEPATPTPTSTPQPQGCVNLIANGGWEDGGSWRYGTTPFSAQVVSEPVHTGEHALQQGVPAGADNRLAHSSAFQEVTIPADAEMVELRYWARPGGIGDGVDFREVRLLTSNYGNLVQLDRNSESGDDQWREEVYDLSAYRGRTVVLYFNVYNNGSGSQLWTYIDDVSLLACNETAPTDTPTPTSPATSTVTPAATATISPTVTPTGTNPITATVTPTLTPTPVGTPNLPTVLVSPTSLELDLRQGERQAAISFDDGGAPLPWRASAFDDWVLLPVEQGMTDEELIVMIDRFSLPEPAATPEIEVATNSGITATSSISITFPTISDAVSVDVAVTYGLLDHTFLPVVSGGQ